MTSFTNKYLIFIIYTILKVFLAHTRVVIFVLQMSGPCSLFWTYPRGSSVAFVVILESKMYVFEFVR